MAFTPLNGITPKTTPTPGASPASSSGRNFVPMEMVDVEALTAKPKNPLQLVQPEGRRSAAADFSTGFAKKLLKTTRGLSMLPVAGANLIYSGINKATGANIPEIQPFLGKDFNMETLEPDNGWEKFGGFGADMMTFLLPAGMISKTSSVAGNLASRGAAKLATDPGTIRFASKAAELAAKGAVEGISYGGITAAQNNKIDDDAKLTAIISAAFPLVGEMTKRIAPKIMETVIKPSEADYRNGFSRKTLTEFGIGGSISNSKKMVEKKLNGLSQQLAQKLKDADAPVDVKSVFDDTVKQVTDYKSIQLGQTADRNAAIADLKNDLDDIINLFAENGVPLNLSNIPIQIANDQIKRGAGTKGSWVYGKIPHDKAVDFVYSKFYGNLKTAIEKAADDAGVTGVKGLNASMHKLIPVASALNRALNRSGKNNIISLSDSMFLLGSAFNPQALAVYAPYYASRSGSFAGFLQTAHDSWKSAMLKAGIKAGVDVTDDSQE